MEVAEGIHRIEAPFGDRVNATYLLIGTRAALLVDTTTKDTAITHIGGYLDRVDLDPQRLRYVLNTHSDWDHMAGNGAIRALAPDAVFCCHELDRPMIEDVDRMIDRRYGDFAADHGHDETDEAKAAVRAATETVPIDVGLTGGEVIDLGSGWRVTVLHTPGHSWGSISVYDPRSGAVVVGDAVLGDAVPTAAGAPAFPPTYRYLDTYLATIGMLTALAPRLLLSGHYPVYSGDDAAEFLYASRAFTDRVDRALVAELDERPEPVTLRKLTTVLGPRLGDWPVEATAALFFPLSGHVERLVAHGAVDTGRDADGHLTYRRHDR